MQNLGFIINGILYVLKNPIILTTTLFGTVATIFLGNAISYIIQFRREDLEKRRREEEIKERNRFFTESGNDPGSHQANGISIDGQRQNQPANVKHSNVDQNLASHEFSGQLEIPHTKFQFSRKSTAEMIKRSQDFYDEMKKRRSIRFFSDDPVPIQVVENVIKTAGTSPSGAHTEPWTYAVVSQKKLKREIRRIVESEEEENYKRRMGEKWVSDLRKFRTNSEKPYLETAPYLICVFKQLYSTSKSGERVEHYYNEISCSISIGILLAAIQNAGLVTLTSTPLNSGPAIRKILGRPRNEKLLMLLPLGFPAKNATVPELRRKNLNKILVPYK